uniref:Uncharacterized protein n=1 Tax=Strombidium inclinatum TaxID=197538 RepID=A0A7S3IY03_9SPIT|mmetsp:Transcript_6151/g.9891  ORF Transcript_6151/g.9891 Transcript_6151/m.9891 type:complete len:254 (+) Transcript_6151:79-840(+)
MQYTCVLTSEYNLSQYHGRGLGLPKCVDGLFGGPKMTDSEQKDFKMKYKALGSSLSTVRMVTRFGDLIDAIRWFIKRIVGLLKGELKLLEESKLKWVMTIVELCSGFFDNWVFLARIQIVKYRTRWSKTWVDWLSTAFALAFISLCVFEKLLSIYRSSLKQLKKACYSEVLSDSCGGTGVPQEDFDQKKTPKQTLGKLFRDGIIAKKWWFVQKAFDYPVLIYYLREDLISRGQGHALSFVSPWVFLYRYYYDC